MQLEASPDEDDGVTLEIESDIQLILSVLCESDMHRKVKDDSMPQHVSTSPLTMCEMKKRKVPVLKLSRRAAGAVWSGWSGDGCSLPEEGLQQVPQRPGTQQAHPHHGRLCLVGSSL